jgi:hypothetical protein
MSRGHASRLAFCVDDEDILFQSMRSNVKKILETNEEEEEEDDETGTCKMIWLLKITPSLN